MPRSDIAYYCASCDQPLGGGESLNAIWARHRQRCRGGPPAVPGVMSDSVGPRCGKALAANDRSCSERAHHRGDCLPAS